MIKITVHVANAMVTLGIYLQSCEAIGEIIVYNNVNNTINNETLMSA